MGHDNIVLLTRQENVFRSFLQSYESAFFLKYDIIKIGDDMKKQWFVILICFLLMIPMNGFAKTNYEKFEVEFSDCVDGDTAKFYIDGEEVTARFLAVDTPETKHPTKGEEPYGKEASNYTCNALKEANKIELQYDMESDEKDKYDRILVWVFVDGELLQDNLIKEGLAEVAYLYGDYQYTSLLEADQEIAKNNQVGKWSGEDPIDYETIIIVSVSFLAIMILCIVSVKYRKKTINKVKRKAKNKFKKELKKYIS